VGFEDSVLPVLERGLLAGHDLVPPVIPSRRPWHVVAEPAQDDEREDYAPVLRLLVDAAQLVGDRPDEGSVVSELRIGAHAGKA